MTEDSVELRRFVENGDEEAFRKLVERHAGLVYGTALRLTNRDASLAEDVMQSVFTDLARKAAILPRGIILAGWLYQSTRFAAAKTVRTEQRRRAREQEASAMQYLTSDSELDWDRLRPALDAAMGQLTDNDRNAVLLHYFEGQDFRTVGAALGVSDDAAQKRVSRALDRLRTFMTQRAGTISRSSLSAFLSASLTASVSPNVVTEITRSSLVKAASLGSPGRAEAFAHKLLAVKYPLAIATFVLFTAALGYLFYGLPQHTNRTFTTVDLSAHCNGALDVSWTPAIGNNHLAALGNGRRELRNVPFDIHGVVQLQGTEWKQRGYNFPESIKGIHVALTGRKIHLLHANSAFADPSGTTVANFVLHYLDGDQADYAIRQGVEVLDWWEWPRAPIKRPSSTNTVVAWTGSNPASEHQGARVRLFDTAFNNPHPEKEIQSVDYISAMAGSAPFMVALTIEH